MAKQSTKSKRGIARMYLEKNPNGTFAEFKKKTKNKTVSAKDFSNALQYLKSKGKRSGSLTELYKDLPVSRKHPVISKYIIDNPDNTYTDFKRDNPTYKIYPTNFSHIRCKLIKLMENGNNTSSRKFKQKLITIIAQPTIPDFKDKNELVDWLNKEIIGEINKSQSVCKFQLARFAYPENVLELRKLTAK